ncbi:MAG TPA: type IV toxin-antitoxin system AbiEi family antitoxin domain-containing protein [Conexibacter sp.]|nr:type IV toxin-antitoxin system AbiEi family antitoxin domain-containing protein [Conexibacter sp.]
MAALAGAQHGVVTRRQLRDLGLTSSMVEVRIETGLLIRLHRGVYAVGHRQLRAQGHWLAAVLACGPGAALSHREAAALHGLRPSSRGRIDVTTPRRLRDRRAGIDVHHATTLKARDVTNLEGIPVTTVERTLVDLANVVPQDSLAKALREAEHLRIVDAKKLQATLERARHRPGSGHARLTAVLEEHRRRGAQLTRSVLEDRFLKLCERHGLPRPRTNLHVEGLEVDACWPDCRLAVELDGWARHQDRYAFQRDREKGNALTQAGWRLLRFTHDEILRRPAETAALIAGLLATA